MMILINGRPSPLMGKNKAEVLQQILGFLLLLGVLECYFLCLFLPRNDTLTTLFEIPRQIHVLPDQISIQDHALVLRGRSLLYCLRRLFLPGRSQNPVPRIGVCRLHLKI